MVVAGGLNSSKIMPIFRDEKGVQWFVDDIKAEDTKPNPILDPGTGPARVITVYKIKALPGQKREDVLKFHRKQIEADLTKRHLSPDREMEILNTEGSDEYDVIVVSGPATHNGLVEGFEEKPMLAQDILQKESQAKKRKR